MSGQPPSLRRNLDQRPDEIIIMAEPECRRGMVKSDIRPHASGLGVTTSAARCEGGDMLSVLMILLADRSIMPNLKGMNVEALMKLRDQVDERVLFVAIGLGVGIALAIIGYLLHWISA
jgi:hypothetical protein